MPTKQPSQRCRIRLTRMRLLRYALRNPQLTLTCTIDVRSYRLYNKEWKDFTSNPCCGGWCTRTKFKRSSNYQFRYVLTLVLMDDALVRRRGIPRWQQKCSCLNPCFNGWCTRTHSRGKFTNFMREVLILVLMEDALVLLWILWTQILYIVLILVVMDDALALQNLGYALFKRIVRLVCAS